MAGGGAFKDMVLLDVTPLTLGIETTGGIMTPGIYFLFLDQKESVRVSFCKWVLQSAALSRKKTGVEWEQVIFAQLKIVALLRKETAKRRRVTRNGVESSESKRFQSLSAKRAADIHLKKSRQHSLDIWPKMVSSGAGARGSCFSRKSAANNSANEPYN